MLLAELLWLLLLRTLLYVLLLEVLLLSRVRYSLQQLHWRELLQLRELPQLLRGKQLHAARWLGRGVLQLG